MNIPAIKKWRVRWEIDVFASTPREAASMALDCLSDGNSIAHVFEVRLSKGTKWTKVDLDEKDPAQQEPEVQMASIHRHAIPALRELARERCNKSNCGSICLCGPCHARKALEILDPSWRPR